MIDSGASWTRELAGPNWRFIELPMGHWPMFSRPAALAALLLGLSNDPGRDDPILDA